MSFRLGAALAILGLTITFWLAHLFALTAIFGIVLCFLFLEMAMFEILGCSKFNLVIGKASEAICIRSDDTFDAEWVCVPVHIRIFIWEAKGINATIESGITSLEGELRDRQGRMPLDTSFDLTYDKTGGWIPLACRRGDTVFIGTPDLYKPLGKQSEYPIKLLLRCRNTIVSRSFVLKHDMTLSEAP